MSNENLEGTNFDGDAAREERVEDVLHRLYGMLITRMTEASEWYMDRKGAYKDWSRRLRFSAIVLSTLGLLIPVLITVALDSTKEGGISYAPIEWIADLSPTWGFLVVGIAAALVGVDRLMGISTGWVRYVRTALDLQHRREQFVLEWWSLQTLFPLEGPVDIPEDLPFQPHAMFSASSRRSGAAGPAMGHARRPDMVASPPHMDSPPQMTSPPDNAPPEWGPAMPFPGASPPRRPLGGYPSPVPDSVRRALANRPRAEKLQRYINALWRCDRDARAIIQNETDQWIQEFQSSLQALNRRLNQAGTDRSGSTPVTTADLTAASPGNQPDARSNGSSS